jgi:uncharacterized protein YlxP (DUF503 family)
MFVGVMRLSFHIPHARSLKDKRSVVRRFRDRVRARFEVSIAEVGDLDLLQRASFGVTVVSNDAKVCASVLEDVAREASLQEEAVLLERSTEIVPYGDELFGDSDESTAEEIA